MVASKDCVVKLEMCNTPNKKEDAIEAKTKEYLFFLNISKNDENANNLTKNSSNTAAAIATKKEFTNKFSPPLKISSVFFGIFITINKNSTRIIPNIASQIFVILLVNNLSLVNLNVLTNKYEIHAKIQLKPNCKTDFKIDGSSIGIYSIPILLIKKTTYITTTIIILKISISSSLYYHTFVKKFAYL